MTTHWFALLRMLVVPFIAGLVCTRALGLPAGVPAAVRLAVSWVFGATACAAVMLGALGLGWMGGADGLGLDAALLGLAAATLVVQRRLRRGVAAATPAAAGPVPVGRRRRLLVAAVAVLAVLPVFDCALVTNAAPITVGDEATIWNTKARALFSAADNLKDSAEWSARTLGVVVNHADYPDFNPLLQLWGHAHLGAQARCDVRWIIQLFGVALVLLVFGAGTLSLSLPMAFLMAAVAARVVNSTLEGQHAGSDVIVAIGWGTLAFAAQRWWTDGAPAWGRLAFLGAAVACWSKHEGAVFPLLLGGLILTARVVSARGGDVSPPNPPPRDRVGAVWFVLPVAVLAGTWARNLWLGLTNDLVSGVAAGATPLADRLGSLERWQTVAAAFSRLALGDLALTGGVFVAFLMVVVVRSPRPATIDRLLATAVVLTWVGYFLVFVATPNDLAWHLNTAATRIMSHALVPMLLVVVSGLRSATRPMRAPA